MTLEATINFFSWCSHLLSVLLRQLLLLLAAFSLLLDGRDNLRARILVWEEKFQRPNPKYGMKLTLHELLLAPTTFL